jgi:regulator of sirC expression with transglutaminase-like and TPR domain
VAHVPADAERQLIDVYDGAVPVSREDAEKRIRAAAGTELSDEQLQKFFEPVTKRAIIVRMLTNLLGLADTPAAGHRYLNAILAIDPDNARYHAMRADVRLQLGDRAAARTDVDWLLEHEPPGLDLERIRQIKAGLERD